MAPSPDTLGTLNGIALTSNSFTRAITPALASSIYAYGVSHHVLWGQLGWLALICAALAYGLLIRFLPEKAEGWSIAKKVAREEGNGEEDGHGDE
jgi:hypothetical protein